MDPLQVRVYDRPTTWVVCSRERWIMNYMECGLDPFPTKLLMAHVSSIINIILRIVNLCFSTGDFPASCKSAIISHLIKKQGLDSEILKNYRPVANFVIYFKNH